MESVTKIYSQAQTLGVCTRFTGKETPQELMKLMLTPQGKEFCITHNFPDMDTMRGFRGQQAESHGIYIDTPVKISNAPELMLVGNTHAILNYDDPQRSYNVTLMHGATADITATNWALVFVAGEGATRHQTNNARIL